MNETARERKVNLLGRQALAFTIDGEKGWSRTILHRKKHVQIHVPNAVLANEKLPSHLLVSGILTQVVDLHELNLLPEVYLTQGAIPVTLHRTLTRA